MSDKLDLASLFQAVTHTLNENKEDLNKADGHNHNHGDNMVEIFQVITQAMEEKHGADPADQLAYASELLRRKDNGSAQMYSQGLSQAAEQFQGQKITANNAIPFIQTLLGGGEAPPQAQPSSGDVLGTLLSGLGGGQKSQEGEGLDAGDLLSAGLAFLSSKQAGESNLDALVDAMVASTAMGQQSQHRAQSSTLVTNTLMSLVGQMAGG